MSEFGVGKAKPLSFKGINKSVKQTREEKKRKFKIEKEVILIPPELIEESKKHGGWWIIDRQENISSAKICLQHASGAYWTCLESGEITLGEIRESVEGGPIREEIFTLARVTQDKFGIKTCNDRYVGAYKDGVVYSRTEAISPQESLGLVIQDGKIAILSHFGKFFSYSNGVICANSETAVGDNEIFTMRTNKPMKLKRQLKEHEVEDLTRLERTLVKKFQNFSNQRIITSTEPEDKLNVSRIQGNLCEEMLNRRSKVKSDKYCK